MPIWWQRVLIVIVGLFLSFGIPAHFGLVGATLFFVAFLCFVPAALLSQILVFSTMPLKYVRKRRTVTTLFQR